MAPGMWLVLRVVRGRGWKETVGDTGPCCGMGMESTPSGRETETETNSKDCFVLRARERSPQALGYTVPAISGLPILAHGEDSCPQSLTQSPSLSYHQNKMASTFIHIQKLDACYKLFFFPSTLDTCLLSHFCLFSLRHSPHCCPPLPSSRSSPESGQGTTGRPNRTTNTSQSNHRFMPPGIKTQ